MGETVPSITIVATERTGRDLLLCIKYYFAGQAFIQ